jgi:hypothetical protein
MPPKGHKRESGSPAGAAGAGRAKQRVRIASDEDEKEDDKVRQFWSREVVQAVVNLIVYAWQQDEDMDDDTIRYAYDVNGGHVRDIQKYFDEHTDIEYVAPHHCSHAKSALRSLSCVI